MSVKEFTDFVASAVKKPKGYILNPNFSEKEDKRAVILDIDGVIADSSQAAVDAINSGAAKYGIPLNPEVPITKENIRKYGAWKLFEMQNLPKWKIPTYLRLAKASMNRDYSTILPIPGVSDLLSCIDDCIIAATTTNSIENFNAFFSANKSIDNYIDILVPNVNFWDKPEAVRKVLRISGIEAKDALYIGDEERDLTVKKIKGITVFGFTGGYASREILESYKYKPNRVADTMQELIKYVTEWMNR